MRWTYWVFLATVCGLANQAAGNQPGCANCNGGMQPNPWSGGPCDSPCGFAVSPGWVGCRDARHCCDNSWNGYCAHRAKVDACLAQLGTGAHVHTRPCRQVTAPCPPYRPTSNCVSNPGVPDSSVPNLQPTPAAAEPTPAPMPPPPVAPNKSTRSVPGPRLQ